jgi:hypothetical protein
VINPIQDHWLALRGNPAGETPADRDPDALPHFLFQASGRGGDQLPGGFVQQEHRRCVGLQDVPGPLQQHAQEIPVIQPGQLGIGDRLDVPQPSPG